MRRSDFKQSYLILFVMGGFFAGEGVWAETKKAPTPAKTTSTANTATTPANTAAKPVRKKELDFEERIIEGLTDRGLESFTQTGTIDPISKEKLYRKRDDFEDASKALLREMEYLK